MKIDDTARLDKDSARQIAERLNRECRCQSVDRAALEAELDARGVPMPRPQPGVADIFAPAAVFVESRHLQRIAEVVLAVEQIVRLPGWQQVVAAWAPETARHDVPTLGAFLGYDFHLAAEGPRLIEINTNAGGGMLCAQLMRAQRNCCDEAPPAVAHDAAPEDQFLAMFLNEWRLMRGDAPLLTLAIVDENPGTQFLYPEFRLFARFFSAHGIDACIAAPSELEFREGALWRHGQRIDMVYNRLTDFALAAPPQATLREAWLTDAAVITPHPAAYSRYADKRNLTLLSDSQALRDLGAPDWAIRCLRDAVPPTRKVEAKDAERLWSQRRELFFKPVTGYGSRAAYRGDKLTRRVFDFILQGDYVAQQRVEPSERLLTVDEETQAFKLDLRAYAYAGAVQLLAARLYRGQTTNFRTPGGGFAPVFTVTFGL